MSKVSIRVSPYYTSPQKRLFDVTCSIIALFVSWPIILLLSLIVFFDSGWPIFFAQNRTGQYKKIFTLYKLRTMKLHAPDSKKTLLQHSHAPYPMFKMNKDPRYTRIGEFLSQSGLDELPQIINILKGEMSWVGPRPLPVEEAELLPQNWNFRYKVKPGIISEWAVHTQRYQDLQSWRQLEIDTVVSGSMAQDIKLMLRTLQYLFRK